MTDKLLIEAKGKSNSEYAVSYVERGTRHFRKFLHGTIDAQRMPIQNSWSKGLNRQHKCSSGPDHIAYKLWGALVLNKFNQLLFLMTASTALLLIHPAKRTTVLFGFK